MVVYDFGCVKRVPVALAASYAELLVAAAEGRGSDIPDILQRMGLYMNDGSALPSEVIDPYVEMFGEILRASPPYTFGDDEDLYRRIFDLGMSNWQRSTDMQFPEDAIFVDRAFGGHFGNISRLRATGPWRDLAIQYASVRSDS